jgi:citrate lyase subunit beta/citryl-CoA lyase
MTVLLAAAIRSWLYVPGDQPDKLTGAAERGPDALIVDLEDGVAPTGKDAARRLVTDWLRRDRPRGDDAPAVWVRVNNNANLMKDLEAIAPAGPDGIVLPKAEVPSMSRAVQLLGVHDIALGALIETARGLLDASEMAMVPRVTRLAIGEADLAADLGLDPSPDERELWPLRSQVVVASAAAGIEPPCGPVSTDFRDLDAFRASTESLRRAGFGSRSAIHPAQVAVINEVFTPTAHEVEEAAAIVAAHEDAVARGNGITIDAQGRMVDEAVIRSARRTLGRARVE